MRKGCRKAVQPVVRAAVDVVAQATGTRRMDVIVPRDMAALNAHHVAIYLALTQSSEGARAVADMMGKPHSVVVRAARRVEERRDEPAFDRFVARLETQLGGVAI